MKTMKVLEEIFNNVLFQRVLWSLVVVTFALLIYRFIAKFLNNKEKKSSKILSTKKNKTFMRMLKSVVGTAIGIVTALMVLQIFGVDVTSMLAGVGIASIVIGFAIQDALKDIIRGFDIVSDEYYEIGDMIKFGDNTGQVLSINLRTTKIKDINTDNIVSIANRNIDQVEIVSNSIYFNVPLPRELAIEKAEKILESTIKDIKKDENVTDAKCLGFSKISDSSFEYLIFLTCDPILKLSVRRKALRAIINTLEANKISVPYNQLDIHNKK